MKDELIVILRQTLYVCLTIILVIAMICGTFAYFKTKDDDFRNRELTNDEKCIKTLTPNSDYDCAGRTMFHFDPRLTP